MQPEEGRKQQEHRSQSISLQVLSVDRLKNN